LQLVLQPTDLIFDRLDAGIGTGWGSRLCGGGLTEKTGENSSDSHAGNVLKSHRVSTFCLELN
jgi:hypothetical protein